MGKLGRLADFVSSLGPNGASPHRRQPSGQCRAEWSDGRSVGLLFIDAVHDYANTRFDIETWLPVVASGGIIAMHDVDQQGCAGTRRAVAELLAFYPLFAHVDNLAAFRIP